MATFDLHISCSNIDEFSDIAGRLCGASLAPYEPETGSDEEDTSAAAIRAAQNAGGDEPVKPKRTRKGKAAAEPTQAPDGTPIPPAKEPLPQPTPGGTEAPPAESIPPNQQADVFSNAATVGGVEASTGQPAATAAQPEGVVDLTMLKDAMADLLRVKSAGEGLKVLEAATGCKSLSSGSPSVVEKSKDDPGIMQRTLDALKAAAVAA